MVYNVGTIEERFWQKVDKAAPNDCWLWIANKNNHGYGLLYWKKYGRKVLAHRVSYEIHIAPLDKQICVLHKCDTPACVNPSHLFLGTKLDNVRDMIEKGRKIVGINPDNKPPRYIGESHPRATITEEIAREIKASSGDRKELMLKYGVAEHIIKSIRSGRTWKHL